MTTQTLQKSPEIVVAEGCHTLVCRIRTGVGALLSRLRSRHAQRAVVRELRRLDARRLDDIGLGDPQRQYHQFGVYFDAGNDASTRLDHRLDVRR